MDNVDHYYSWPPHCGRPARNGNLYKRTLPVMMLTYINMCLLQADFPSVAGLIEDLDYQLDADDISGRGHKEKKYYIDTVNIKIPRKGMEMTGFLRDGMSEYSTYY